MINVSISAFILSDEAKFVNLGQVESFFIRDLVVTQEFTKEPKISKQMVFISVSGEQHTVSMTEKAVENFLRNSICMVGTR